MDDDLLERARALARRRGVSLQEPLRDQLRLLARNRSGADAARELLDLIQERCSSAATWSARWTGSTS
ncbi:MAG TPA: hypothetical protein VHQ65_04685 [Thermoanaerobaculia bacterium]|nr:hypothetical protein [Thermoanaerobaculia bacterium]